MYRYYGNWFFGTKLTRGHTLKCLAFFTDHCHYADSPKYRVLPQVSHKLNMIQENEVKVR